ncbi:hypothetical protein D0869_05190 [Hortaea werneckii]|uniref:Uncharacterized protein n=1 Tax=Hortaea werneckii TaxID=91943 RepID=A0A3M6YKV4_HORWE|nr:hypothetical protein KC355_g8022 [Hortaea werneckii]KAI7660466.1 hypothetical protein KC318_g10067 [Hortaea werneckii]RMX83592.1 hypothetical protein D0869_05190 [Hortaea werneckii]RMY03650.1 hypothetical protein D0867_10619 [Hortaea werneckii]RMY07541.1 hypothetical protein D0868_05297 [Hortaea werneckii]
MAKDNKSISDKMSDWIRNILSCCDKTEEDERPRSLQISGPTNFRREDISIAGLDPEHQAWIREKAKSDAQKMWAHLQPLHSSPSSHFADPNNKTSLPSYEDFTQPRPAPPPTTTTAANPATTAATAGTTRTSLHSQRRVSAASSSPGTATAALVDKIKAHTRKISGSLGNSLTGYHHYQTGSGKVGGGESGTPYEMRSLIDPRHSPPQQGGEKEEGMRIGGAGAQDREGKMSGESGGSSSVGRGRGGSGVEDYSQGDGDSGKGLGCAEMVKKGDGGE